MKSSITLFSLQRWASGSTGTPMTFPMPQQLRDQFAQADSFVVQLIGTQVDTNAQVQLKMYATPYGERAPSAIPGTTPFWTGTAITSQLNGDAEVIAGPFADHVEFVLEVSASAGSTEVAWTGLVALTIITLA